MDEVPPLPNNELIKDHIYPEEVEHTVDEKYFSDEKPSNLNEIEPDWKGDNRIKCKRCGRILGVGQFMKGNGGQYMDVCKECVYAGIDNLKPDTFKWILERYDIPFVRGIWLRQTSKAFFKNPQRFTSRSVIGTYIRSMKMTQYRGTGFKDSQELTTLSIMRGDPVSENEGLWDPITPQDLIRVDAGHSKEMEDFDKGVMDKYLSKQEKKLKKAEETTKEERKKAAVAAKKQSVEKEIAARLEPEPTPAPQVEESTSTDAASFGEIPDLSMPEYSDDGSTNFAAHKVNESQNPIEQQILNSLTSEDISNLTARWGTGYYPSEWLQLEELYRRYENEYELTADRAEVLRKMCKVSLKMDQALDDGETSAYKQLSSVYDQLRKSAKFTEAQKEEKKEKYLDSIGELVAVLEREGGPIPAFDFKVETTQDIVDYTLRDMQNYTYNLAKKELGLGELIESYIRQLEENQANQQEMARELELQKSDEVVAEENLSVEEEVERSLEEMDM